MPITLAHLKKNTRNLILDFGGEQVAFSYRPGAITPALSLELADEETRTPTVLLLVRALVAWDVLDDATQLPLPINEATLLDLPQTFLSALLHAIMSDTLVGNASSATSGAG